MRFGSSANGTAEAVSTWIVCHIAVHLQPLLGHRCSTFSLQKGTSYTSAKIVRDLIWRCKQLSTYLTVTIYLESAWTSGHEPHSSSPRRIPPLRQIPVGLPCGPLHRNSPLRVHHDITSTLDKGSTMALVMLDQSPAFDVIDHDILLQRLEFAFGISGRALNGLDHTCRIGVSVSV